MASLDTKMILTLEIKTPFSWWQALKLRLAGPAAQQLLVARLRMFRPDGSLEYETTHEVCEEVRVDG